MSKTILVTGGAGYNGSHACKALAKAGYQPIAYDNLVHGHREAVRWGPFVEGDLADLSLLSETIRRFAVAAIMHFAGFAYVGESVMKPEIYFRNNVVNSFGLLETMLETGCKKIVFSSSCATYGLPQTMPIGETTPQRPVNPYGESKLMIERALHWLGEAHGLGHVALRYFNAAGADPDAEIGEDHDPETHLIPLVLDAALGRRAQVDIFGTDYPTPDGTAIRDYIHVQDLRGACAGARSSRRWRGEPGAQSRHRAGALRAHDHCRRRAGYRPPHHEPQYQPPTRRSAHAGRRSEPSAPDAGLDTASLQPRGHHRHCMVLASAPPS